MLKSVLRGTRFLNTGCSVAYRHYTVLGIESSCDDSSVALISNDGDGKYCVLNTASTSQQEWHNLMGGINPTEAWLRHKKDVPRMVDQCMEGYNWDDVDAIAVTNRPGLRGSLIVGVREAILRCVEHRKPLICVHHMRAHALVAKLTHPEVLDKAARALRIFGRYPEMQQMSGGAALEKIALQTMREQGMDSFDKYNVPVYSGSNCDFSFAGVLSSVYRHVDRLEEETEFGKVEGVSEECIGPIAASMLHAMGRQLSRRVQRAVQLCEGPLTDEGIIEQPLFKSLVVAGGCACNSYWYAGLKHTVARHQMDVLRPPPNLCTDNGTMIAFTGLLQLEENKEFLKPDELSTDDSFIVGLVESRKPIGDLDLRAKIADLKFAIENRVTFTKCRLWEQC